MSTCSIHDSGAGDHEYKELANRLVKALLDAEEYYINISNAVLGAGTGGKRLYQEYMEDSRQ